MAARKETAAAPLTAALGGPLPEGLSALTAPETEALVAALAAAKAAQRKALRESSEAALSHVPMLLRGAVRKVLLG